MSISKEQVEALKKMAEIDQRDGGNAFEVGFAKAAQDMGLSEEQYGRFCAIARQKLSPTK